MTGVDGKAFVVKPGEGTPYRTPFGDVMAWKAGAEQTQGGFSMHERTAPPGARSFSHVHSRVIEAFYVIEGVLEFEIGGDAIETPAGTFVLAPAGVPHAWKNTGATEARALVFFSPPAERGFFEDIEKLVGRSGDMNQEYAAVNKRYGFD